RPVNAAGASALSQVRRFSGESRPAASGRQARARGLTRGASRGIAGLTMLTRRVSSARRAPRRSGDLRAAILRAARRLYLAHGSDAGPARRVARAIGTSPTAIYLHFRGLGDILEHLRMEGHELLASYLTAAGATLPALERLREMGRAYFRFGV